VQEALKINIFVRILSYKSDFDYKFMKRILHLASLPTRYLQAGYLCKRYDSNYSTRVFLFRASWVCMYVCTVDQNYKGIFKSISLSIHCVLKMCY